MKEHLAEKTPERILTETEVMDYIFRFAEKAVIVRSLSDEQGLYLLEAKIEGADKGETVQYEYMRKGRFPNGNEAGETAIYIVNYQDSLPTGGQLCDVFDSETGAWRRL